MAKIVILEDDYILLDLYSAVLEGAEYQVFPATTVHAVKEYFVENTADLIIADLRIGAINPEETVQTLQEIREQHPVPIVLISAKMAFYEDMCREAGFEHMLRKPFPNSVLVQFAEKLILND